MNERKAAVTYSAPHIMKKKPLASIYNAPVPRQEWIGGVFMQRDEKNEESWVELFVDLVYVVLLSKLGHAIHDCALTELLNARIVILFCALCLTRQAVDEYANRFYSHDLLHKSIYLVYTAGLFILALNFNSTVLPVSYTSHDDGLSTHDDGLSSHDDGLSSHDDGLSSHDDGLASHGVFAFSSSTSSDSASSAHPYCVYVPSFGVGIMLAILVTRVSTIACKPLSLCCNNI